MIFGYKNGINQEDIFHSYVNLIKKNSTWNLNTIINPTLIKNSNCSSFPKNFIFKNLNKENKIFLTIKSFVKFYIKNIYFLLNYFIAFILCKFFFKKKRENNLEIIFDVFGLVDKTIKDNKFSENYLEGIYEVLEKYNINYSILLRPYGVNRNPFKLKQFFKIIAKDKRDFVFEYEFLNFFDFVKLLILIMKYPFHIFHLKQNENSEIDKIFNAAIIEDINHFNFNSLTRYILGKNLSKINSIKKIYSWYEFQVIERSFNYAIKKNCNHIELIGLFNTLNTNTLYSFADNIDHDMMTSPHQVFLNSKYHTIKNRNNIKYNTGVSLRYQNIFSFKGIKKEKNILVLGSYQVSDTRYLLESVKKFDEIIFKNHPAVDIKRVGNLFRNISVTNKNIYDLFETSKIVIGTSSSGSNLEAVSCGVSVIIVASQENYTENPLVKIGQGKIWDLAFNRNEIFEIYEKLIKFRQQNKSEIMELAKWYKDNFFIEPTENNIVKLFRLDN
jgi:hypothetical protein